MHGAGVIIYFKLKHSTYDMPEIAKHGLDAWDLVRFRRPTPEELRAATCKDLASTTVSGQPSREPEIILDCHYNHWRHPEVGNGKI